jgi:hypothetical protein
MSRCKPLALRYYTVVLFFKCCHYQFEWVSSLFQFPKTILASKARMLSVSRSGLVQMELRRSAPATSEFAADAYRRIGDRRRVRGKEREGEKGRPLPHFPCLAHLLTHPLAH